MMAMHPRRQLFLDETGSEGTDGAERQRIRLLNWNISNPSKRRAVEQVKWIRSVDPEIVILTETKLSDGCRYIHDRLLALDYGVVFPEPLNHGYGVMLASKHEFTETGFSGYVEADHRARVASIMLGHAGFEFEVTGVYVPIWRDERKRRFLECLIDGMSKDEAISRVFCGDLNILEPDHKPRYPKFEDWEYSFYESLLSLDLCDVYRLFHPDEVEYSWVGWKDNGYRYDHVFASQGIIPFISDCRYLHEPRMSRLSDHSAMLAVLDYS